VLFGYNRRMKYIIGLLIIVALALAGFFISEDAKEEINQDTNTVVAETGVAHSIVLTPDGYEPSEISIKVGDKIIFSAHEDYGNVHWPASNLHPTHAIYSEFDPLSPIEPDATWSFVFGKVGEWRFHDHITPYHTGVITVE